jgi:hypothetical protein
LRSLKTRAQPERVRRVLHGFRISPGGIVGNRDCPEEQRHLWIQGTEADGILPMLDRFAIPTRKSEAAAQVRVGGGRIGIEVDRAGKRRERLLGAPFHQGAIAQRDVSPGIAIVEGNRSQGVLAPGEQPSIALDPPHVRGKHQAET